MPLFKCTGCGCVENTAVGRYWGEDKDKVKCSECHEGKWHGLFAKKTPDECGYVQHDDGFYGPDGGWK